MSITKVPWEHDCIVRFLTGIGFILPADQIISNSDEVIDGLIAMINEARALNYF